jgi:hypothetical protein
VVVVVVVNSVVVVVNQYSFEREKKNEAKNERIIFKNKSNGDHLSAQGVGFMQQRRCRRSGQPPPVPSLF